MKKINLNIVERLIIPSVMPQSGGIEMLVVKGIIDKVRISPKEIDEFKLEDAPGGSVKMSPEAFAKSFDYDFEECELQVICKGIKSTNEMLIQQGKITLSNLYLADKFGVKAEETKKKKITNPV